MSFDQVQSGVSGFEAGCKEADILDPLREGLVCLCHQFGCNTSYDDLGYGLPLDAGSLLLEYVPKALKRVGIQSKVERIDLDKLSTYLLPALLIMKDGGTLILISQDEEKSKVLVPSCGGGLHVYSTPELKLLYSGISILAKPEYRDDGRAKELIRDESQHWFGGEFKKYFPAFAEIGVSAIVANLLAISTALFALQVYDRVVPNGAFDTLWILASGVVLAVILEFALRSIRAYLVDITGKKLDIKLGTMLFEHILRIRLNVKPSSTGAFTNQVKEFEGVREFLTSSAITTLSDIPFVFIFIALIAYLGGVVAWVPLVSVILMLLPSFILQGRLARLSREGIKDGAVRNGLLIESVENLETLKSSRAEGRSLRLWERLSVKLAEDGVRVKRLSAMLSYGAALFQQLCYVSVVIVGVYQINIGELTVGGLIACTILSSRSVAPVNQFTALLVRWQHVKIAMEGLNNLMKLPCERPGGMALAHKSILKGNYCFSDVKFQYVAGSQPVLNIERLKIQSGDRIILLGGNGSGKSTLLRLMAGLTDVSFGNIMLDDVNISQIDPADKCRDIGYLPQDVALFYGTLRDNLSLDGEFRSDEEFFEALDATGMGRFVRSHPLGLDMPISGSRCLSGGQRQAIGLSRLLLQDPKIVLMDEPTAAFDQVSEQHIIKYLKRWLHGRTLIVSTHKRALLSLGNTGIVLENGHVKMHGSLNDLMQKNIIQVEERKNAQR